MQDLKVFLDNLSEKDLVHRLDLALEGANLGIWDWDLRDNSVQFDRRWCEMLGLVHDETPMELDTWESRVHPDDIDNCYRDIKAYLEGKTEFYQNIHRMQHTDGSWVYILDRGRVSGWDDEGNAIRFTGTHFNVTATEQAKEMMLRERERLIAMIENLPTSVAMFDLDFNYIAASKNWLAQHKSDQKIMGSNHFDLFVEDRTIWKEIFEQAANGAFLRKNRFEIQDSAGDIRWINWVAQPWRDSADAIAGIIVSKDDVTDQVLTEMKLNQSSKMVALGEMAGGIAHEINNPLAIITTSAETIKVLIENGQSSEKIIMALELLQNTGHRISKIVQSLRSFSRDTSAEDATEHTIQAIVEDALNLCSQRLEKSGIAIKLDLKENETKVLCRPLEAAQILINLINNSRDALANKTTKWLKISSQAQGDFMLICVTDSGDGISEKIAKKIMNPFFTTKPIGQGTGLGLSVSKGLAESNGGSLEYVAEAQNTQFCLSLPLKK